MSETYFCWYCRKERPKKGALVMRWKSGKAAGKIRGYKCAGCVAKANQANQNSMEAAA